jgi:hypothetical protein
MAGIVPALIAGHNVEARCQQVDDFSFAFVAPLGAKHGEIHHRPTILLSKALRTADGGCGRARRGARPSNLTVITRERSRLASPTLAAIVWRVMQPAVEVRKASRERKREIETP